MYRQSLGIRMGEGHGQAVVPAAFESILAEDVETGYIYVLRSLSDDPQIIAVPDLHKIGFSRGPVEKRITQAANQPTYLYAPVEIVATYRTYNLKTSALEHLLHRFFSDVRLDVKIGRGGRPYEPLEWYSVPFAAIDQAIELITSGDIVDFEYDSQSRRLTMRNSEG